MSQAALIAIVDDDPEIRDAVEGLVTSIGYSALTFASAEELLVFPRRTAIDCMIVDVRMPGLSGIELQSVLKAEGRSPPMIFMSSYGDESTRKNALLGGARDFLPKPVDAQVLLDCLEAALDPRLRT